MAGMLELMDVGPDFSLPGVIVDGGFAAGGAAGVEFAHDGMSGRVGLKFDEDAADFLDVFVLADHVFVAEDEAKAEFAGFALGLGASVERTVLGAQLLSRVAGHPKGFFVEHSGPPQENLAPKVPPTA